MEIDYWGRDFYLKNQPERAHILDEFAKKQGQKFSDNELDAVDTLALAYLIDADKTKEILEEHGVSFQEENEMAERFHDSLDADGAISIPGSEAEFLPSAILKQMDPAGYQDRFSLYTDDHEDLSNFIPTESTMTELWVNREELEEVGMDALRASVLNHMPQFQASIEQRSFERDTAAVLADNFNPNATPEANMVQSDAEAPARRQRMRL